MELLLASLVVSLAWAVRLLRDAHRWHRRELTKAHFRGWNAGAKLRPHSTVMLDGRPMVVSSMAITRSLNEGDAAVIECVDPLRYIMRVSTDGFEFKTTKEQLHRALWDDLVV